MSEKVIMKGNEALAEAAIRAGCRCFFGYPITPQTEVAAYMSKSMPKAGGVYLQAESEIAAINMIYGAAASGVRCMTSSSSPGISLKSEGISYICGADLPAVIVNMTRGGPGLGGIQPAQSDYFQATRGIGHGDAHLLVFAPAGIQEMVDLMTDAFDKADQYRMPAMILGEMNPMNGGFRTDIVEEDSQYVLECELPGFAREDISVDVEEDRLVITARREARDDGRNYIHRERTSATYQRSFSISNIQTDSITAAYHDGILTLNLPKFQPKTAPSRKITIE